MADSERVDADPDPTFHIDADSDPNFTQFVKEVPVPPRYLLKRKTIVKKDVTDKRRNLYQRLEKLFN